MRYVLGNVRISQSRLDSVNRARLLQEAFSLHEATLDIWLQTLEKEHHKTGDAYHKLGWHHLRQGKLKQSQ
jgi:hypothetical protein